MFSPILQGFSQKNVRISRAKTGGGQGWGSLADIVEPKGGIFLGFRKKMFV